MDKCTTCGSRGCQIITSKCGARNEAAKIEKTTTVKPESKKMTIEKIIKKQVMKRTLLKTNKTQSFINDVNDTEEKEMEEN